MTTISYGETLVWNAVDFELQNSQYPRINHGIVHNLIMTAFIAGEFPLAEQEYLRIRPTIARILCNQQSNSATAWGYTLLIRKLVRNSPAWPSRMDLMTGPVTNMNILLPTIYIVCPNPAVIESEITALSTQTSLRIEVNKGTVSLYCGCTLYETHVNMGRSIACAGTSSVGTLGGWVTDITTGEQLAITAGHVVMGHRVGTLSSLPHIETGQLIVQPADPDYEDHVTTAKMNTQDAYEKSRACGFMRPKLELNYQKTQSILHELESLEHKRDLGRVSFSSFGVMELEYGDHIAIQDYRQYRWKDYALITAYPERTGECSFGHVGTNLTSISGTIKPRGGLPVRKSFTRSTGPTTGAINGIYLDTNVSSTLTDHSMNITTSEWIVIGDGRPWLPMSASGDSGGLVTDQRNSAVGMIIGGVLKQEVRINGDVRLVDNITIITSADEFISWIKKDVGRDVVFE